MRLFLLSTLLYVFGSASALADVQFCNKTSDTLDFASAARVTSPYETQQASGWFRISPGKCRTIWSGDYTGEQIYFHVNYPFRKAEWRQAGDSFTFCMKYDAFIRYGTWHQLQFSCPSGYFSEYYWYANTVTSSDFTSNFED
jgi:uncharacterized membrane protein